MFIKVARIILLAVSLATCVESKEKIQVKLKQLSPYLQPPPLLKTSSTSATTKLGAVKPRSSLTGKVRIQSAPEDSPSVQRVPRWNFAKESAIDTIGPSKDRNNHGSSQLSSARTKLLPLISRQRQQTASSTKRQRAILPYSPNQQTLTQNQHLHHSKDCNPCNKVPWIPMLEDHSSSALDTSIPDSVGHYSHHRDLPVPSLHIANKQLGSTVSDDFALKLSEHHDFGSDLHKSKDGVTYLPPTSQFLNTWTPSNSYVTPHNPTLQENVNSRLVHSDKLPPRLHNQNVRLRKHPGPMYRYLLPPPIVPQFPEENKIVPSLSSHTASKIESLYGLPFFIPHNITSHQNVKFIQPTLYPPSIQQAIPFTVPNEISHSVNENLQLNLEHINYQNRSAHGHSTQFYEPPNYFSVPPLYEPQQFSRNYYNLSLPGNLVPPGISVGNAFSTEPQGHNNNNQVSHSSQIADSDLKLLDIRGSNFDLVSSIPVSEESYNLSEATNFNDNLSHTTVTEPSLSVSQPSEDQVISPSQNNQNPNTDFYNPQQHYANPGGTHYFFNAPQQAGPNLEVIKSVQVANYISSIEYPLQIIHSPYIDINTSSPIESGQNKTFQPPTTDLHQFYYETNTSQANLNSDTSDIIVGKPVTHENNYYNIFNATNGENINNISNFEEQNFRNTDDLKIYNDSLFESNAFLSGQNISNYFGNSALKFLGGNEDYSTLYNSTSKNTYQFEPQLNGSQDSNVRLVNGDNYNWYNSQYEVQSEKNKDTVGEDSHSITNQQIAYFSPSSTPSPQKVTVYIQPSIQTSALRGASLVHQINNLKHHYQPVPPFANNQFLSSHPHNSPHNLVKFPRVSPILQQQVPAPFRDMFRDIENMQPPPFNYIGVINRPVIHPTPSTASPHSSFNNKPPQNFLNPNTRPSQGDNTKWTTIPGSTSLPLPTKPPLIPAWNKPTTSMPLQDSVHGQSIHSVNSAVLLPPPIQQNKRPNLPAKNTKPIQIIVPYTSGKDTFSFPQHRGKPLDVETTGWSPITGSLNDGTNKSTNCSNSNIKQISECNTANNLNQWWQQQEDYHQHQESRTVTATASATSSPFHSPTVNLNSLIREATNKQKPITITQQHILASNIQELLRGEQENITFSDSIDQNQLQKYIDEWTASEYSSFNTSGNTSKSSDIQTSVTPEAQSSVISHHLIPSKKIPAEYLTTPPSIFDDFISAENSIATAVPRHSGKTIPNILVTKIPIRGSNSSVVSPSLKDHISTKSKDTSDQKPVFLKNSYLWNTIIRGQEIGQTATTSPTTTDTTTEATTYDTTTEIEMTSSASWEDLQVSISPITKEKVYVVTPLSTWPLEPSSTPWPSSNSHKGILSNTPKTTETGVWSGFPFRNSANTADTFHSPRFSIRPTPGSTMQRSFTVTNDDNDFEESKVTTFYPAENEISYTYNSRETGEGGSPRSGSSTKRSTTDENLWGLTDLPTYTPPVGTRIHTYSGHSRVVTTPTVSTAAMGQRSSPRQPVGILKKYQPDRNSYLWHFPELLAPSGEEALRSDETAAVRSAIVELQKEKQR